MQLTVKKNEKLVNNFFSFQNAFNDLDPDLKLIRFKTGTNPALIQIDTCIECVKIEFFCVFKIIS